MGFIKDIHSNLDIQAFPGAHFEIVGDVPAPQCSEYAIEGDHGLTFAFGITLTDPGKFAGYNLNGKFLHITSPPPNVSTRPIVANSDNHVQCTGTVPDASPDNVYTVTDGGELILTRDVASFAQYIHAAGWAYTIKGGKLYTNMPSDQLKTACSILFDPLT